MNEQQTQEQLGIMAMIAPNPHGQQVKQVKMKLPKSLTVTRDGQPVSGIVTRISAEIALATGKRVFKTLTDEDLCPLEPRPLTADSQALVEVVTPRWSINQKFDFMSNLIRMVIDDVTCSLVITGSGGLGKSTSVFKALKDAGLVKDKDFTLLKGYTTPRGFYEFLYRHNSELIVIDDCDSVFDTETGVNILKGALDSFDDRSICWQARESARDGEEDAIPNKFEFTGRIIFISNRSQEDVPQPIRSRSMKIDLTMDVNERLQRIEFLLPNLATREGMSLAQAKEAYDLMAANKALIRDINIRTMVMTLRVRKTAHIDSWKDLAVFQLVHN
jgi:hypothetical protein